MDLLRQYIEDARTSRERDDGPLLDAFTATPRAAESLSPCARNHW